MRRSKQVTPEMRSQIRKEYGDGSDKSLREVAEKFGLAISTIGAIVNNDVRARALEEMGKTSGTTERKEGGGG